MCLAKPCAVFSVYRTSPPPHRPCGRSLGPSLALRCVVAFSMQVLHFLIGYGAIPVRSCASRRGLCSRRSTRNPGIFWQSYRRGLEVGF